MMNLFKLLLVACLTVSVLPNLSQAHPSECVILLHGIARSHTVMTALEKRLKKANYFVVNRDYSSTTKTIKAIAEEEIQPLVNLCLAQHPKKIHFVTHSMGGIVLQTYLHHHSIHNLGRIVMLSPPNHGSHVSDLLQNNWLYKYITGPAGQELTTKPKGMPYLLTQNQYDIGIISGTYNFVPFSNYLFNDANDGAVSVSSCKSPIMKDFITVPVSHAFMNSNPFVHFQILNYLANGKFRHNCPYVESARF